MCLGFKSHLMDPILSSSFFDDAHGLNTPRFLRQAGRVAWH